MALIMTTTVIHDDTDNDNDNDNDSDNDNDNDNECVVDSLTKDRCFWSKSPLKLLIIKSTTDEKLLQRTQSNGKVSDFKPHCCIFQATQHVAPNEINVVITRCLLFVVCYLLFVICCWFFQFFIFLYSVHKTYYNIIDNYKFWLWIKVELSIIIKIITIIEWMEIVEIIKLME